MEKIVSCGYRTYGHRTVYMCTADQPKWFEKVDLFDASWNSALCIASITIGNPVGCLGYAKWFTESLRDILK